MDSRARLATLVDGVDPWDEQERRHLAWAAGWIAGDAPLHRVRKPDVPATHLVSYFVVLDEVRREVLLVAHRTAGLWLPSGGHVEPGEDPWDAVVRECREELHLAAVPSAAAADRPLFLTVTRTRGAGPHTDVSLWFVVRADASQAIRYDRGEFAAIRWATLDAVLAEPVDTLDPHMHRFTEKLRATLA